MIHSHFNLSPQLDVEKSALDAAEWLVKLARQDSQNLGAYQDICLAFLLAPKMEGQSASLD